MKGFIGRRQISNHEFTIYAWASSVAASQARFWPQIRPGTYGIWKKPILIVLVGSNLALVVIRCCTNGIAAAKEARPDIAKSSYRSTSDGDDDLADVHCKSAPIAMLPVQRVVGLSRRGGKVDTGYSENQLTGLKRRLRRAGCDPADRRTKNAQRAG